MTGSSPRLSLAQLAPDSYRAMRTLADTATLGAERSGVDDTTVHLIKIRVSQVNGCRFCIRMHTVEAQSDGVTADRIFLLDAWRQAPESFSATERAALGLAEAITNLQPDAVADDIYESAREHFTDPQIAHLIFVTTVMNAWNRLAISARLTAAMFRGGS